MRTVYDLCTIDFTFTGKNRYLKTSELINKCWNTTDTNPETLAKFDTKNDAKQALQNYQSIIKNYNEYIVQATFYYIEEYDVNDEEEFLFGSNIEPAELIDLRKKRLTSDEHTAIL